ncbi:MAG TPA: ATP-binding protein [Acidimicrobiia bacterium]|nr:ATP-binding protein [Acidimicrobiia bacterium]
MANEKTPPLNTGAPGQSDEAEIALPPEPQSAPAARRFVLDLGWVDDEDTRHKLSTLVSEVVTNAVLHARTPLTLKAQLQNNRIRVSVIDGSETLPRLRRREPTAATGRGLLIVQALADRWGVDPVESGKTVWFELDRQTLVA